MIEMTCCGCGWEGHVLDLYAGRRVTCRRCRTVNTVPESVTREVDASEWIAALDPSTESLTAEINTRGWAESMGMHVG
jgi:hypothetical protein